MKNIIQSITEAYSMQPETFTAYPQAKEGTNVCFEIKLETKSREGDGYECYKGYTKDGKLLFEYWKGSVNVNYSVSTLNF